MPTRSSQLDLFGAPAPVTRREGEAEAAPPAVPAPASDDAIGAAAPVAPEPEVRDRPEPERAEDRPGRWSQELPSARGAAVKAAIRAQLGIGVPAEVREPEAIRKPLVLSVAELAARIRGALEERLGLVHVRGEISNLRQPGTGHLYFTLKDDAACVSAVLFRREARSLRFALQNGQEVIVRGRVSYYEASGDAQIVCDSVEPVGAGALALAFEQLKVRLAAQGLFEAARKRPIPMLPRRIGVVTSPSGAAIRDFLRVLHRRFPGIEVLIAPAKVQGEGAAAEIAEALRRLGARGDCEVIVVTRGGGSLEDLWAFNEEIVARAIVACPVPVVSAVGHEVDTTIADFVADLRAPTPTAAAELLAPVEAELRASISVTLTRMRRAALHAVAARRAAVHRQLTSLGDPRRRLGSEHLKVDDLEQRGASALRRDLAVRRRSLRAFAARLQAGHPANRLKAHDRTLTALRERLERAFAASLEVRSDRVTGLDRRLRSSSPRDRVLREAGAVGALAQRLGAASRRVVALRRAEFHRREVHLRSLSPVAVLARGYAVAFRESGAVLTRASDARPGERLDLELAEGSLRVEVIGPGTSRKPG